MWYCRCAIASATVIKVGWHCRLYDCFEPNKKSGFDTFCTNRRVLLRYSIWTTQYHGCCIRTCRAIRIYARECCQIIGEASVSMLKITHQFKWFFNQQVAVKTQTITKRLSLDWPYRETFKKIFSSQNIINIIDVLCTLFAKGPSMIFFFNSCFSYKLLLYKIVNV